MPNKKHFTQQEVFDLVENNDVIMDYSSAPHKHGQILETYVVIENNICWRLQFLRHDDEGWLIDDDGLEAIEVFPQNKMITEWVCVEENNHIE